MPSILQRDSTKVLRNALLPKMGIPAYCNRIRDATGKMPFQSPSTSFVSYCKHETPLMVKMGGTLSARSREEYFAGRGSGHQYLNISLSHYYALSNKTRFKGQLG